MVAAGQGVRSPESRRGLSELRRGMRFPQHKALRGPEGERG
jgi:hypothetical protein